MFYLLGGLFTYALSAWVAWGWDSNEWLGFSIGCYRLDNLRVKGVKGIRPRVRCEKVRTIKKAYFSPLSYKQVSPAQITLLAFCET